MVECKHRTFRAERRRLTAGQRTQDPLGETTCYVNCPPVISNYTNGQNIGSHGFQALDNGPRGEESRGALRPPCPKDWRQTQAERWEERPGRARRRGRGAGGPGSGTRRLDSLSQCCSVHTPKCPRTKRKETTKTEEELINEFTKVMKFQYKDAIVFPYTSNTESEIERKKNLW